MLAALLSACAAAAPRTAPPPLRAALPASPGEVAVGLFWAAAVDLDLYVTGPSLETVYFANARSADGGRLERDVRCGEAEGGVANRPRSELVVWRHPPPGRYRVGVDFIDGCGGKEERVGFRVVAEARGRRLEATGVASASVFQPVVLEFDVPEGVGADSGRPGRDPGRSK